MSEIAQTDNFNDTTIIKVVGVGGAGGNAVNRMIAEGLQNVEFVAINTDAKDLLRSDADVKISLSDASSRGLGAGADPEKGAKAAQDHQSEIEEAVKGADMVFVTCGEGGGTGTGASPLVARAARQQGALTIAVVTRPFSFEGPQRAASAALGIDNLREEVDALIVIPNDRLLELDDSSIGIVDAFRTADTALLAGVQASRTCSRSIRTFTSISPISRRSCRTPALHSSASAPHGARIVQRRPQRSPSARHCSRRASTAPAACSLTSRLRTT